MPDTDNTVRIVHLSDLHFDVKNNDKEHSQVWKSLKRHISIIKPELILVTGDIVDTPSKENFSKAKNSLDSLGVQYFVCAGNHDRHRKGIATPFKRASNLFEEHFTEELCPTPLAPKRVHLGDKNNKWIVRITGVDTSRRSRYTAQGFINEDDLGHIRNYQEVDADNNEPPHLLILILHHHLLPLRASETSMRSRPNFFKWLTSPTNPGTILETLAMKHFDLVLHGHEHHKNMALYGSYEEGSGQVAVLASGTAVGMNTLSGPELKRASFSVLELRSDRSVWVKEVCGPGNGNPAVDWIEQPGSERLLLDNTMLRRHRFLREKHRSIPLREHQKHITITKTRAAIIDEKRTHWDVDGNEFKISIKNETGYPGDPKIIIKRYKSGENPLDAHIRYSDNQNRDYYCCADAGGNGDTFEWIKTSYTWFDSIILTQDDFKLIGPRKGPFRCDGMEFVAATVDKPLGSLTLSVSFPAGFMPKIEKIMVFRQRTDINNHQPEKDESLLSRIIYTGTVILVTIPYPFIKNRYIITWEPINNYSEINNGPGFAFQEYISSREPNKLANDCLKGFSKQRWADSATVAIYLPERNDGNKNPILKRVSYAYGSNVNNNSEEPPKTIRFEEMPIIYLRAWRNETSYDVDDGKPSEWENNGGRLEHEKLACAFPLKPLDEDDWSQPWAVVRVGISQQDEAPNISALRGALANGNLILLNKLTKEGQCHDDC